MLSYLPTYVGRQQMLKTKEVNLPKFGIFKKERKKALILILLMKGVGAFAYY